MFDLEKLIRTLRNHGVYRLEVTFFEQPSDAPKAQLQGVGDALSITGLNSAVVEFFTPVASAKPEPEIEQKIPSLMPVLVQAEKKADDGATAAAMPAQVVPPVKPREAAAVAAPVAATPAAEKPVAAEPVAVAAAAGKPAIEESAAPAAEPSKPRKREKKGKAVPAAEASASSESPADVYERFVETIEHDDGTKTDLKRELIGQMSLDDMLRVNAGFCLGLDTDVATEALRSELLQCFI